MNSDRPRSDALLLYCRPGFEAECGQEIEALCAERGLSAWAAIRQGSGWLLARSADGSALDWPVWDRLIFARQRTLLLADCPALPEGDRLGAVLAALPARRWRELRVEHADSDAGRELAGLCRAFANAARPALNRRDLLDPAARDTLHLFFVDGRHLLLAESRPGEASPHANGIPRLRRLREAPSRSALKLDEALQELFQPAELDALMRPGQQAVDLGAAPGGWTWVLMRRHLRVQAIDNGPLDPALLDSGLVEHLRADGFRWRPARPVDWLVCDMVEQPARVAALIVDWLSSGLARQALFNLKLPMKKRWQETRSCLERLEAAGIAWRARQLYHDREEITVRASAPGAT